MCGVRIFFGMFSGAQKKERRTLRCMTRYSFFSIECDWSVSAAVQMRLSASTTVGSNSSFTRRLRPSFV